MQAYRAAFLGRYPTPNHPLKQRMYDRARELFIAAAGLEDPGLARQAPAPMLLVNGRDDVQNSIQDIYVSLDHGHPKTARVFDGGHMGEGPVVPTIGAWLDAQLT
jgi:hypothetical protein